MSALTIVLLDSGVVGPLPLEPIRVGGTGQAGLVQVIGVNTKPGAGADKDQPFKFFRVLHCVLHCNGAAH